MRGSHCTACSEYDPEGTPDPNAFGESEALGEQVQEVICRHGAAAAEVCSGSGKRLSHQVVKLLFYDVALS